MREEIKNFERAGQKPLHTDYLTDEQLQRLIADVEEHELVTAPPDLMEAILGKASSMRLSDEPEVVCEAAQPGAGENSVGIQKAHRADADMHDITAGAGGGSRTAAPGMDAAQILAVRNREFHRYCIRVAASVAAAIGIMFAAGEFTGTDKPQAPSGTQARLPSKAEVMSPDDRQTKEEALSDPSVWSELFGGSHIFNGENSLGIFSK